MARLTEVQKEYIVDRLACYSSPTQVVDLVKDLFGVEIVRQQVQHYDPTVPSGRSAGPAGARSPRRRDP